MEVRVVGSSRFREFSPGHIAVRGWRMPAIDRCLDFCARIPGYVETEWVAERERDSAGRYLRQFQQSKDYKLAWARRNREASKANSKLQWEKTNERARSDYASFVELLKSSYPRVHVRGFDFWRRSYWALWRRAPDLCVEQYASSPGRAISQADF